MIKWLENKLTGKNAGFIDKYWIAKIAQMIYIDIKQPINIPPEQEVWYILKRRVVMEN